MCEKPADGVGRCNNKVPTFKPEVASLAAFVELVLLFVVTGPRAFPDLVPVRARYEDVVPEALHQKHVAIALAARLVFAVGHDASKILQECALRLPEVVAGNAVIMLG